VTDLAGYTTLRVGGPARDLIEVDTEADLVEAVRSADASGTPLLVIGGGSNLLIADEGFDGRVVVVRTRGISADADACGGAVVRVAAGEQWDGLIRRAVEEGWLGVEALSGIPGSVGATPIQNVGAYGQEVASTIASVRCWDREAGAIRTLFHRDCAFGYRTSVFKSHPDRYVVLEVVLQFRLGDLGLPVRYAELAARLGIAEGGRAPAAEVRAAVLALRSAKGMVLDSTDHDTWSAGSFFTNPVVAADLVPAGAPTWPVDDDPGLRKTSAAWLIEHAGFAKGHGAGAATLSTKHTLALTNRGDASAADLLALAREVRDGVRDRFDITLVNEPVLVGCSL
jgi:UDP-N-acetylmuramate dehydrogenase